VSRPPSCSGDALSVLRRGGLLLDGCDVDDLRLDLRRRLRRLRDMRRLGVLAARPRLADRTPLDVVLRIPRPRRAIPKRHERIGVRLGLGDQRVAKRPRLDEGIREAARDVLDLRPRLARLVHLVRLELLVRDCLFVRHRSS
jgi:hypothetical protein